MGKLPYGFFWGCILGVTRWQRAPGKAWAAEGPPRHSLQAYTDENGLPQNAIQRPGIRPCGFSLAAMPEGLVRFDGRNFKVWNPEFSAAHLVSAEPGSLYAVGLQGNVLSLRDGQTHALNHVAIPPSGYTPAWRMLDYLPAKPCRMPLSATIIRT